MCHWCLFLRFPWTTFQHWLKKWLGAEQATGHYLNQWWLVSWRIYAHTASMTSVALPRHLGKIFIWPNKAHLYPLYAPSQTQECTVYCRYFRMNMHFSFSMEYTCFRLMQCWWKSCVFHSSECSTPLWKWHSTHQWSVLEWSGVNKNIIGLLYIRIYRE